MSRIYEAYFLNKEHLRSASYDEDQVESEDSTQNHDDVYERDVHSSLNVQLYLYQTDRKFQTHSDIPEQSRSLLRLSLSKYYLFSHYNSSDVDKFIDQMKPIRASVGQILLRQGEFGNIIFCVEYGAIEIKSGGKLLALHKSRSCFGDLNHSYNNNPGVVMTVGYDCLIWALDIEKYHEVAARCDTFKTRRISEFIRKFCPCFNSLSNRMIQKIITECEIREFEPKVNIVASIREENSVNKMKNPYYVQAPRAVDGLYIIFEGVIRCKHRNLAAVAGTKTHSFYLTSYGAGDIFRIEADVEGASSATNSSPSNQPSPTTYIRKYITKTKATLIFIPNETVYRIHQASVVSQPGSRWSLSRSNSSVSHDMHESRCSDFLFSSASTVATDLSPCTHSFKHIETSLDMSLQERFAMPEPDIEGLIALQTRVQILQSITILKNFPMEWLREMAEAMTVVEYENEAVLVNHQDCNDVFRIIEQGEVVICKPSLSIEEADQPDEVNYNRQEVNLDADVAVENSERDDHDRDRIISRSPSVMTAGESVGEVVEGILNEVTVHGSPSSVSSATSAVIMKLFPQEYFGVLAIVEDIPSDVRIIACSCTALMKTPYSCLNEEEDEHEELKDPNNRKVATESGKMVEVTSNLRCSELTRDQFQQFLMKFQEEYNKKMDLQAQEEEFFQQYLQRAHGYDFEDLQVQSILGQGSFGLVKCVFHTKTQERFALKCMNKQHIIQHKQQKSIINEKECLIACYSSGFIVNLIRTYNFPSDVCMLLEYESGGDLWTCIYNHGEQIPRNVKKGFSLDTIKFYVANIICMLEYLKGKGIIFRDLKPENLLLSQDGYLKLTDFGFAKKLPYEAEDGTLVHKTYTVCGTPEYVAPEIVLQIGYDNAVDMWALGCLTFEMHNLRTPFASTLSDHDDSIATFQRIMQWSVKGDCKSLFLRETMTMRSISKASDCNTNEKNSNKSEHEMRLDIRRLESFISSLLSVNPIFRLGCGQTTDVEDLKSHPFLADICWDDLQEKRIQPPFIPTESLMRMVSSGEDVNLDEISSLSFNVDVTGDDYFKDF